MDLTALRDLAVTVAYRMVGSRADAEDLAQEALVRVQAAATREPLRSPEAYTTTVTTRLALDHLRSARVRREAYVGPWLPEPVADGLPGDRLGDPQREAELADSLSFAFLVVLETLGPVERAAFLLHDVFGLSYPELAETLERSEPACRKLVSRARRRVADRRTRHPVDPARHRQVVTRFVGATRTGDLDQLMALLTEDAVLVSDGGAERKAARWPIVGRDRVARFLRKVGPKLLGVAVSVEVTEVNGEPGLLVLRADGHPHLVGTVVTDAPGTRIQAIHWVLNPAKLHAFTR
jgi:RNA polymerase sigma-70 factor, ECF subfamily